MSKFSDYVYISLKFELECLECMARCAFHSDIDNACAGNVDPTRNGMISIDEWVDLAAERAEKTLGWVVCEEGNGLLCNECKNYN